MENRLRIGLDVAPLLYPYSGVRAYVEALIDSSRNGDTGVDLVPISAPSGLLRSSSKIARLNWDLRGIAVAARGSKVELLHMTRFAAPRRFDGPLIVTVHDLIPLQLPEYRSSRPARIQSALARALVPHATRVIVPSSYVAGVVQELLRIERERIDVIPMGVSPVEEPPAAPVLSGPYVLHTGGFDARKNLTMLLQAFARASWELGPDWRLVLVGSPHSNNPVVYPPVEPVIEQLGLGDRVVRTGRVDEQEKNALYAHASIAVNPSRSEGFGLPILEAMAHGVPVVASNRTSHPEVAGDAAFLVEPTVEAFSEAMIELATDDALRTALSAKGRARCRVSMVAHRPRDHRDIQSCPRRRSKVARELSVKGPS
ncbi:MAG: glycosyltransferase family 1 protein [Thermomicrobiales bacterium]